MRKLQVILVAVLITLVCGTMAFADSDTQNFLDQTATTYWTPNEGSTYYSPYYRWNGEGWSWQHQALTANSEATLYVAAWDVDAGTSYYDEHDKIYAKDNGAWVLLGELAGASDAWGFTTFTLGNAFYNDIASGLEVKIEIDVNNTGWAVALSKSVLTTDGTGNNENPNPGAVPEPASMLLLGLGLAGVAALRRK